MFFFHKMKFREVTEPCILHGPTIKRAKKVSFNVDGTEISISLPRDNTNLPSESVTPKAQYQLNGKHLDDFINVKKGWGCAVLASRTWDFYGPRWGGKQATLTCSMAVMTPRELEQDVSFFHPRSFEYMLGNLLTFERGDEFLVDGQPAWQAPQNWRPVNRFETVAVRYDVQPSNARHLEYHQLSMPVTDHFLLQLRFRYGWHPHPSLSRDWLDRTAIHQLIDDITDSLQVKLSPEAQAQQRRALEGVEDASLIKHYPPLQWSEAGQGVGNDRALERDK